jgi:hypothetical protein
MQYDPMECPLVVCLHSEFWLHDRAGTYIAWKVWFLCVLHTSKCIQWTRNGELCPCVSSRKLLNGFKWNLILLCVRALGKLILFCPDLILLCFTWHWNQTLMAVPKMLMLQKKRSVTDFHGRCSALLQCTCLESSRPKVAFFWYKYHYPQIKIWPSESTVLIGN